MFIGVRFWYRIGKLVEIDLKKGDSTYHVWLYYFFKTRSKYPVSFLFFV